CFFFSSRRRHTRWPRDWSSDVCSSDLEFNLVGIYTNDHPGGDESQFWLQWKYFDENVPSVIKGSIGWYVLKLDTPDDAVRVAKRSEERRVGKECGCLRAREEEKKGREI